VAPLCFSFFVLPFFCFSLGLGLADLMSCCETLSCNAHRHNDVEGHRNISSTIYSFFISFFLCLEPHYCGAQQWRLLTEKLNPPSAFVHFRWFWSWSCYFGHGLNWSQEFGLVYITGV